MGTMMIMMKDGRVFQGTASQIVRGMQAIAFGVENLTLSEYTDWVVTNALKFEEIDLHVKGRTDEELAESLVEEMLRTGLARRNQ
jgi:hypothetical protein